VIVGWVAKHFPGNPGARRHRADRPHGGRRGRRRRRAAVKRLDGWQKHEDREWAEWRADV